MRPALAQILFTGRRGGGGAPRPFPPEHGHVVRDGIIFRLDGQVWDWRGATMFLLFARERAGEDMTRTWQWLEGKGVNVVREFLAGVGWGDDYLPYMSDLDFAAPFKDPQYRAQLEAHYARAEQHGIRIEGVIGTDNAVSLEDYRRAATIVYEVAGARPLGHFVEGVNEPWNPRMVDPVALLNGINRHGVLSAYGIQPSGQPDSEDLLPCPYLDYGTIHLPRDRAHMHNGRDLDRCEAANPCPWVDDEYLGFAEYDKSGGGARTTELDWIVGHFAISRLFGHQTMHCQAGLEGRAPFADTEPITEGIAAALSAMWSFIPGDAYTGQYTRAGMPDFPAVYHDKDSEVNHAYGSIQGGVCHAVLPLPTPQWHGWEATNGWRLDAVGPQPYLARFVR